MLKRIFVYCILGLIAGYYISGQSFSAPSLFKDWQVTQLVWAAKNGNIQKIDKLITQGVDVNTKGELGFTPLAWIFLYVEPNLDVKTGFKHLLINGASVSQHLSFANTTILHFAAGATDPDYLQMILKHGKDVNLNDNRFGDTPLTSSIYSSQYENFETLIKAGANVKAKDSDGDSTFSVAKGTSSWRFVLKLIELGTDYNIGKDDITPGNKIGTSDIVWTLENMRYWPEVAKKNNRIDYREKVIEFLRGKGVEVYPWYPEDDPRHNPRPVKNPAELFQTPFPFLEEGVNEKHDANYMLALRFLNMLQNTKEASSKNVQQYMDEFKVKYPKMMSATMHKEGVYVYEAKGNKTTFYTTQKIEQQLENSEGLFLDLLAQLSYHYSQPYPQYNSTRYRVDESEQYLFVHRGGSYGFLFTNSKTPKLLRIEIY